MDRSNQSPLLVGICIIFMSFPSLAAGQAQAPTDSAATTEQSCSFGMAKGDPAHQCHVPIPSGCVIAKFPGTDKP